MNSELIFADALLVDWKRELASYSAVRISDRPDLISTVARWRWDVSWRQKGHTISEAEKMVAGLNATTGFPQCFVLIVDRKPVGTASLVKHDLAERPNLQPWLAGVVVDPECRGRGYVNHLVSAVEYACRSELIPTLWLYTYTAENIYRRIGWTTVEIVARLDKPTVAVMRRDL